MLTRRSMLLAAGTAGLAVLPSFAGPSPRLTGPWTGTLLIGSSRLRLKVEFGAGGAAALYSLDQGNQPIAGRATVDGNHVRLEFASIGANYAGTIVDATRIDGIWNQQVKVPFTLRAGDAGLTEPLEPLTSLALANLMRLADAPALAAAAQRRGAALQSWIAGRRSIGAAARITPADQWHLGSITKSITATLVARLVDAGEITWNMCVGGALGNVAPDMNAAYRDLTFRHLLSHRGGLQADLSAVQLTAFAFGNAAEIRGQRRRYARLALAQAPAGPAEATYLYSNNGYVIAAAMIEALLGASWEDLVRTQVFAPLGLTSAGFGPPDAGAFGPLRQPVGHESNLDAKLLALVGGSGLQPLRPGPGELADNPRVLAPAGSVHMNLADLVTYLAAHRDRTDLLLPGSWDTLHTPPFGGDYALGWVLRPDGLWHNGSNGYWYAEVGVDRERGIVAAAVCNEARTPATLAVGSSLLRAAAATS